MVDVHEWSKATFGAQSPMRPILGIGEEIAEYFESLGGHAEETMDALADIGIFFMDFCGSTGVELIDKETDESASADTKLFAAYGYLCHIVLKTEQKIKGMDDPAKAKEALTSAANAFWSVFTSFVALNHKVDIRPEMQKTFDTIVAKRTNKSLKAASINSIPEPKDQGSMALETEKEGR